MMIPVTRIDTNEVMVVKNALSRCMRRPRMTRAVNRRLPGT
jgi:hypothetical protein